MAAISTISKNNILFHNLEPTRDNLKSIEGFFSKREIQKIQDKESICYILLENGTIVGAINVKSTLTSFHEKYGLTDAFYIREFKVLDRKNLNTLLQKTVEKAKDLQAKYISCFITDLQKDEMQIFQQNGFSIAKTFDDPKEHLMGYRMQQRENKRKLEEEKEVSSEKRVAVANNMANRPIVSFVRPSKNQALKKHHEATLRAEYIQYIQAGKKTIEGRINTGMFKAFKKGDTADFFCKNLRVKCEITKVAAYKTFREMLEKEGVQSCLPDYSSLDGAVRLYQSIPGYAEKEARFGVLAIGVKKI